VISEPRTVGDKDIAIGKYLLLEIRDTGHGMDSVILEKAFDPYFTTKKMGEGTGLGLSIVKAIVEEHNGFIEVTSITGKGTHFYIYFPIIEQETSKQIKDNVVSAFQGNECIMIVDDEEDIRICFKEILEGYGYRVHLFQNGIDALKAFEKNVQQFDLIITDMTMPGITGAELIQKIHAIRQDIPSILCSGFSGLMNDEKAFQFGVGRCLMKPVSKRDLASAIREMIDKKIS
jgi:CheY-like chemotaxis protein